MILDALMGIVNAMYAVFNALGVGGTMLLIVGLFVGWLALSCGKAFIGFVLSCTKLYRRLPTWGKQIVALLGLLGLWRFVWPFMPKTEAILALVCGFGVAWWTAGWEFSRRYGIDGGYCMWKPHAHHWETVMLQRGLTKAVEASTGKKNGRARKPKVTPTGFIDTLEPPDQMSASEFADAINNGTLEPSLAREIGWAKVNGTFAEVDGNVVNLYVSAVRADGDDPLAKVHRWPGMEMQ